MKKKKLLFSRDVTTIDDKGRLIIPKPLREAIGIKPEKTAVEIEVYPNLKEPKALVIKKLGG